MKAFHAWAEGLDEADIDFCFQENGPTFPRELVEEAITSGASAQKYLILRILTCPSAIAWPIRRLRALLAVINLER